MSNGHALKREKGKSQRGGSKARGGKGRRDHNCQIPNNPIKRLINYHNSKRGREKENIKYNEIVTRLQRTVLCLISHPFD